jgi:hypothetical protein
MKRIAVSLFFVVAVASLASCASNPAGGDTVLDAMGKGAIAGLVEGLTGQEQPNPYLSGDTPAQPQQNASANADPKYLAAHYGKKHADLIVQGHIDLGMNEEEVQLAWGDPAARNSKGKLQEIWSYGEDKVVFTRGKVSAVTH